MGSFIDLSGKRYGRMLVISYVGHKHNNSEWLCRCDCGVEKKALAGSLRSGRTKSCGCYVREITTKRNTTHGESRTTEYNSWNNMKARCLNPNSDDYKEYGQRGITVCDQWRSFDRFLADMGHKPTPAHSLERIDNSRGYSPDNCRWATPKEQANNTRKNKRLPFHGELLTITEFSRRFKISQPSVSRNVMQGLSYEQILEKFTNYELNKSFRIRKR